MGTRRVRHVVNHGDKKGQTCSQSWGQEGSDMWSVVGTRKVCLRCLTRPGYVELSAACHNGRPEHELIRLSRSQT